ncbi:hypothetical protein D4764_07G0001800 [Takifugu flavidus]|uniref:Uncharacterized protein n=1 Tax=Takifugu flavidus TaxID=433684 RepID=A0A5C6MTJ9_9TELE|nr:hypothetical protein D4764_07G0001800 [Takifugu flavidus]
MKNRPGLEGKLFLKTCSTNCFHLSSLSTSSQMMLSCWLHQAGTFSLHLGGLQPCVMCWDENNLSNPDLEAMVFDQKRVACTLQGGVPNMSYGEESLTTAQDTQ